MIVSNYGLFVSLFINNCCFDRTLAFMDFRNLDVFFYSNFGDNLYTTIIFQHYSSDLSSFQIENVDICKRVPAFHDNNMAFSTMIWKTFHLNFPLKIWCFCPISYVNHHCFFLRTFDLDYGWLWGSLSWINSDSSCIKASISAKFNLAHRWSYWKPWRNETVKKADWLGSVHLVGFTTVSWLIVKTCAILFNMSLDAFCKDIWRGQLGNGLVSVNTTNFWMW